MKSRSLPMSDESEYTIAVPEFNDGKLPEKATFDVDDETVIYTNPIGWHESTVVTSAYVTFGKREVQEKDETEKEPVVKGHAP